MSEYVASGEQGRKNMIMTPNHPLWAKFVERLGGPEGCNFHKENGKTVWICDQSFDRPKARSILATIPGVDVERSLEFFESMSGYCDCEILFNVEESFKQEVIVGDAQCFFCKRSLLESDIAATIQMTEDIVVLCDVCKKKLENGKMENVATLFDLEGKPETKILYEILCHLLSILQRLEEAYTKEIDTTHKNHLEGQMYAIDEIAKYVNDMGGFSDIVKMLPDNIEFMVVKVNPGEETSLVKGEEL